MNTNYKSIVLAISLLFALSASISAAPGDLDPTFGNGGKRTDWAGYAREVAIQPDGKIVVVGDACCSGPGVDFRVARYNPDGSPDTTFGGGNGRVTTDFNGGNDVSLSLVLQPDGKIIVAGWAVLPSGLDFGLAVVRYNPDGSLDTTFGGGSGKVLIPLAFDFVSRIDVAIQPNGRILVVFGQVGNYYGTLIRYNADGSLDTSFGIRGSVNSELPIGSVTVQPADGKIVVTEDKGYGDRRIARFNTHGSLDTGFGSGGRVTLSASFGVSSLAIDSAGKIVAAGGSGSGSTSEFALFRFNVDGSPDSSFDGDGVVTTPSLLLANSIVIQSDGKIVAAGDGPGPGNYDLALARYNSNGSLDNTFGGGDGITTVDFNNSSDFGAAVALDSQGRAVVVGGTGPVGGAYVFAIARFLGDPTPTCSNPIDCAEFFVRQHYLDFLNREPDLGGWNYWTTQLTSCGNDIRCMHERRIGVSAAFFIELEFQRTGYVVYRMHRAAFGTWPGASTRANLTYPQFTADRALLPEGSDIAQTTINFANAFVARAEFLNVFPANQTNAEFVNKLFDTAGLTPYTSERQQQIAAMNTGRTRAQVLLDVIEIPEFKIREYNRSFVLMEYFGYLQRDPDQGGYDFWLNVLDNREPNNFRGMVCSFLTSSEYQLRFGSTMTRSNADCAP